MLEASKSTLVNEFIKGTKWQFAKTMPTAPHWYTLLKWCTNNQRMGFGELVTSIFNHGEDVQWGRRTYKYLTIGEFKYWSMDPTIQSTDLINRAYLDGRGPGDLK